MSLKIRKTIPHNSNKSVCQPPIGNTSIFKIISKKFKSPICNINSKEMPFYASFQKASYTIEAAVIMPLFITLMVFGMFIFRLLQVQSGVQHSIDTASRMMAITLGNISNEGESDKDVEINPDDATLGSFLTSEGMKVAAIGYAQANISSNKVPVEFVDGGALGFNFFESNVEGNYIDLKVTYTMTFPVGLLGDFSFDVSQRARNRKWVGYSKAENTTDGLYVYITDHGEVYHSSMNCTYLRPSVHRVPMGDLGSRRNNGGAIYYECKRCKNVKPNGFVYLTDYGTAFHNDPNCTEIKHNIKKVLYEEVKDSMRPCSKCGQTH